MEIPDRILGRFDRPADDDLLRLLEPPRGPVRAILDTDAANEIDDQFALAWALLSPERIELEGVTAEPYSFRHLRPDLLRAQEIMRSGGPAGEAEEDMVAPYRSWLDGLAACGRDPAAIAFTGPDEGMERSYREILNVCGRIGRAPQAGVFRGAPRYLQSYDEPVRSPAAEFIVERALAASDRPLHVAAVGCLTNVASALLMAPEIIRSMTVVWTAGYPTTCDLGNAQALNLAQDPLATRLLFECGAAHVYLPGFHVGAQLRISLPEMETWVRGRGAIGDYLHHLFTHNPIHEQRGVTDIAWRTWVIWDLIAVAWLLEPDWVPTVLRRSPTLDDGLRWRRRAGGHLMREAHDVDRDAIFHDLYRKLERQA